MLRNFTCCAGGILLCFLSCGDAHGQHPEALPSLCIAQVLDDGRIKIEEFDEESEPPTDPNRPPPTVAEREASRVYARVFREGSERLTARRIDGREVPWNDLVKQLSKPKPVLLANGTARVDPLLVPLFAPDTLVLQIVYKNTYNSKNFPSADDK